MHVEHHTMQDITKPDMGVHVQVRDDGRVLWVNVDGICVLRVCQMPRIELEWDGTIPIKLDSDELFRRGEHDRSK